MSEFLERNRKKGLLALLLLFLRWRRGTGAFLLVILLVLWLFVSPSNLMALFVAGVGRFPGGAHAVAGIEWLAGKAGVGEERQSFQELLAAFKHAKENRGTGWGYAGSAAAVRPGSSIDMIRGGADDFSGSASLSTKISGGKSISGIVNPADSKADGSGAVELTKEDLQGERAGKAGAAGKSGATGGTGSGGGSGSADGSGETGETLPTGLTDATGLMGGSQAYATKAMFSTRAGVAGKTLTDGTKVPPVKTARFPGERGKLSANDMKAVRATQNRTYLRNTTTRGMRAFAQLADGRTRAMASRSPYCGPENGCPQEFAAANVGAVFDGNPVGDASKSDVLRTDAPQIDGSEMASPAAPGAIPGAPGAPNLDDINDLQNDANQMIDDAEKCAAAMDSPEYRDPMDQGGACINYWSDKMNKGNCDDCSNKDKCEWMGDQMKACCEFYTKGIDYLHTQCPPEMVSNAVGGTGGDTCKQQ